MVLDEDRDEFVAHMTILSAIIARYIDHLVLLRSSETTFGKKPSKKAHQDAELAYKLLKDIRKLVRA